MKKILFAILVCMSLGLVGCGSGYENKGYFVDEVYDTLYTEYDSKDFGQDRVNQIDEFVDQLKHMVNRINADRPYDDKVVSVPSSDKFGTKMVGVTLDLMKYNLQKEEFNKYSDNLYSIKEYLSSQTYRDLELKE